MTSALTNSGVTKKFECLRCERRFVRREHLQRHERSHTKEKPFGCPLCAHAFTRRDLLVRHNRLNHISPETEGEIPSPSPSQSSSSSRLPQIQAPTHSIPDHESEMPDLRNQALQMQAQVYEDLQQQSYDLVATSPQLNLHTPQTIQWQPSPHGASMQHNVSMPSPATLMGGPIPEPWFSTPFNENGSSNDFSSFLDSLILPSHQFSNFHFEQPLPYFSPDPFPETPIAGPESQHNAEILPSEPESDLGNAALTTSDKPHDSFTQFGSRLPSLQPEDHVPSAAHRKDAAGTSAPASQHRRPHVLTNVSVEGRASIVTKLAAFSNVVPAGFTVVSRHALSRYITGFIAGFHEHLPFLHIATMSVETSAVELVLAMAAIGAQYCRERDKGLEIFKVARAVCIERISRRDERTLARTSRRLNSGPGQLEREQDLNSSSDFHPASGPNETAQALLILMAMATWFERAPAREAPAIRALLETLMREEGGMVCRTPLPSNPTWEEWVQSEGSKRTKFVVFSFFNLHSIVFDIPPMILSGKIDMDLPCMESEWKAPSETAWKEARRNRRPEPRFLPTFASLFRGRDGNGNGNGNSNSNGNGGGEARPRFSSLGSYVLIHALVQHIWLTQELFRSQGQIHQDSSESSSGHLPSSSVTSLEHALKSWQHSWERNPESSVDPLSPHGPLAFNSTALLRLAYIRINIDTGPIRSLGSCNPVEIAASIRAAPKVARSKRMTRAALHCAHALSIPIKLGINSMAHTRLFWSIQHALCSLECALLLTKWLESVTPVVKGGGLSEAEVRVLGFVVEMVRETEWAASEEELLADERRLSAVVVRVWARLFRSDDIWEMVDVIGRSLEVYADMLES